MERPDRTKGKRVEIGLDPATITQVAGAIQKAYSTYPAARNAGKVAKRLFNHEYLVFKPSEAYVAAAIELLKGRRDAE